MVQTTVQQKSLTGYDAIVTIGDAVVGRGQKLSVSVSNETEVIYEHGSRKPVEIKEKKYSVSGSITRMYIDNTLAAKALGSTNGVIGYANVLPYVNIQARFTNPVDGSVKTILVENAKLKTWKPSDITAGGEVVTEEETFDALNCKVLDV